MKALAYLELALVGTFALLALAGCCIVICRLVERKPKHPPQVLRRGIGQTVYCDREYP